MRFFTKKPQIYSSLKNAQGKIIINHASQFPQIAVSYNICSYLYASEQRILTYTCAENYCLHLWMWLTWTDIKASKGFSSENDLSPHASSLCCVYLSQHRAAWTSDPFLDFFFLVLLLQLFICLFSNAFNSGSNTRVVSHYWSGLKRDCIFSPCKCCCI